MSTDQSITSLKTEFRPPYSVLQSCGHFFVINNAGGFETECCCERWARDLAAEMNRLAAYDCAPPRWPLIPGTNVYDDLAGEDALLADPPDEHPCLEGL